MANSILGTQAVTQIGILVHDIKKTAKTFQDILGIEPRLTITDPLEKAQTQYLGKPSKARAQLAFFTVGPNLEIELIEPDKEPSTWRHDLDANGEGVHHIAFEVAGIKQVIGNLGTQGMTLLQTGEYTGGRYAYVDANEKLKVVLELLEHDH
jgi:methylmalonyl-CoA/ethylmalonyl-CoA epimerase